LAKSKIKSNIQNRKDDGITITLKENVQAKHSTTLLENVTLVHNALPEINIEEIDTSTTFLGHFFSTPILIDAMTGGTATSKKINGNLAIAAEKIGIGMGVGSQRAGLLSEESAKTYSIVREKAPSAFVVANIGASQLSHYKDSDIVARIIDMVKADALAVHLNPLQELVQPEGEPKFKNVLKNLSDIASTLDIPIIVKEVGCGISLEVAKKLESAGISAINVAGVGGTSWAGIERYRAIERGDRNKESLGELFWDWGIPTAASLIEVQKTTKIPVIASGGLRNGLEVAKCLVLGASLTGLAYPLLKLAVNSENDVIDFITKLTNELRATMFITGSKTVKDLSTVRYIMNGNLLEWSASLNN